MQSPQILEVPPGFGPGNEGFADLYSTRYCGWFGDRTLYVVVREVR